MTGGRLLTAREVGERLRLSTETVLRRYRRGELPGFRLASNCLRFSEAELDAWLAERRVSYAVPHNRPPLACEDEAS